MLARNFFLLKLYNFLEDCRFYAAIVILYFAQITGSYTAGMGVFGLRCLAQSVFEVPTGILSDKFLGRKYTLVAAAVADFFAVLSYACAQDARLMIVGAVCEGVSAAFVSGTNSAFLYETLKTENKEGEFEHYQGKACAMFQMALFCGALFGSVAIFKSYRLAFVLTLVPKFLQIVVALFFINPPSLEKGANVLSHLKQALRDFKKDGALRLFSIANIVDYGLGEACYQFKAAFVRSLIPAWAVSLLGALTNLLAAVSFWTARKFIRKVGYFKLFFGGEIVCAVINTAAVLLNGIVSPFMLASTALLYGSMSTAGENVFQTRFSDERRATAGSLVSLAGGLFLFVASALIGMLADATSPAVALLTGILLPRIVTLPVYAVLFKNKAS